MKSKIFVLFLLVFITTGFASDRYPINIESDSVKYFGKEQYSLFIGNVRATHKEMKLFADEMKVVFDKNREVETIFCTGNVKMVKEGMYSLSKEAEIRLKENVLVLKGDAKVWQGENYLEGNEVIVYNNDNRVIVNKAENKRVKVIFYPDNKTQGSFGGNKDKESQKDIQKKNSGR
ncbi:MAG: lipopolysaccharide transport periplasmic protein LptA [Calditerrivibrio sp.]|nr:lipopolysaccharide transport periplasmic protein LptA [Calditerrivibrio sp.]